MELESIKPTLSKDVERCPKKYWKGHRKLCRHVSRWSQKLYSKFKFKTFGMLDTSYFHRLYHIFFCWDMWLKWVLVLTLLVFFCLLFFRGKLLLFTCKVFDRLPPIQHTVAWMASNIYYNIILRNLQLIHNRQLIQDIGEKCSSKYILSELDCIVACCGFNFIGHCLTLTFVFAITWSLQGYNFFNSYYLVQILYARSNARAIT